jgi:hypothetical protein
VRFALTIGLALLVLAGCGGGDDDTGLQPVPAAGDQTPSGDTPGVPSGASYDLDGNAFLELTGKETFVVARDFVRDHPKDCGGADAGRVAAYAYTSIGADFPLTAPVADALTEGCEADLQS